MAGFERRKLLLYTGAASATGAAALWFWPTEKAQAAYPFARRVGGKLEPLWQVSADALESATRDDAARLSRLLPLLERAVTNIENIEPRLAQAQVGELSGEERERIRGLWWQLFEPILAVDELKARYRAWYGLDYLRRPELHARAFVLSFGALCAEVDTGLRLLEALSQKKLIQTLFDEAMPSLGLPARTFSQLRKELGRARDLLLVPLGNDWYERWIEPKLASGGRWAEFLGAFQKLRRRAQTRVLTPTARGVENKVDTLQAEFARRWFPLQKRVAEWAGDTRFVSQERRLISDAQLAELKTKLEPGDIILERRNWYLSNVGLPGFWPHAALYAGTQAKIASALGGQADVQAAFGDFAAHLARAFPKAWASLAARDSAGHEQCVVEAVSEGVVSSSVEHSCGADYVAVLRPRVPALTKARAIERALSFWGRPYDFNFDFATDDQVVCSELVIKAYETSAGADGVEVPYVELVGRRAVPPTEFVRTFERELGSADAQFEFVYFLDGREEQRGAVVADAAALATTCRRPKWDLVQP